jgi:hypothetical protein
MGGVARTGHHLGGAMRLRLVTLAVAGALALAAVATATPGPVRVGIEGGFDYAGVSGSLFGHLFDRESAFRPTGSVGVTVDMPLRKRLTLATGLRYVEYAEQVEVTLVSALPTDPPSYLHGTFTFHNTWRYLAIPARVKYDLLPGRGLFVSLGPEAGYLLDVATDVEAGTQQVVYAPGLAAAPASQIFEQIGTFDDFQCYFNRWNVALVGGLGWTFPLASHAGTVEVRYAEGVLDMAKSASVTQRTRGFEGVLGLRW